MRSHPHMRRLALVRLARGFGWVVVSVCVFVGADLFVGAPLSFAVYRLRLTTFATGQMELGNAPFYALPTFLFIVGTMILVIRLFFRAAALWWLGRVRRRLWRMTLRCVDSSNRIYMVVTTSSSLLCVTAARERWVVGVALFLLFEAGSVFSFVERRVYRRARRIIPLCSVCGYNLRGSVGRCPECGAAGSAEGRESETPR